jgi:hypothetical protein
MEYHFFQDSRKNRPKEVQDRIDAMKRMEQPSSSPPAVKRGKCKLKCLLVVPF